MSAHDSSLDTWVARDFSYCRCFLLMARSATTLPGQVQQKYDQLENSTTEGFAE